MLRDTVMEKQRHSVTAFRLNMPMDLGARLRARRKELGLTLAQVAKGAELTTGTISDLEQGRQKGSTKLHRIAQVLGVNVAWLENEDGAKEQPLGVREPAPPIPARSLVHGILVTREGALLGAEFDKIEGDEYRQLVHDFVFGMVAAQVRAGRRPGASEPPQAKVSIRRSTRNVHARKVS